MADWHEELASALGRGDSDEMKAALDRVPREVLRQGVPQFSRMVDECLADNRPEEALTYLEPLIEIEPDAIRWRIERARINVKLDELDAVLDDASKAIALDPASSAAHRLLAEAHDGLRDRPAALAAYRRLLVLEPDDAKVRQRIDALQAQRDKDDILRQALDPEAAATATPVSLPVVPFDPAVFADPAVPDSTPATMVAGLRQHLLRYGTHQSSRNTLSRLDDDAWLQVWDTALASTSGTRVLMHGSELGTLALRALSHGAAHVTIVEPSPIDARIAAGIVQKHLLAAWHARHGQDVQGWSEDERRASFESFAAHVEVIPADAAELEPSSYDWLVVPDLDHTLLGTGIARTVREYRERGAERLRVLTGKARIFATAVQWLYPGTGVDIQALSSLRWSPYPQALDLPSDSWKVLTAPVELGEIDFNRFDAAVWTRDLPVLADGTMEAIVFWFELDIGGVSLNSGVDGGLRCLRPAAQYTDATVVTAGGSVAVSVHVEQTRLHIATEPRASALRSAMLPSWYVPMVLDAPRNLAYRTALQHHLGETPGKRVLDIGAGCGLLSLMAARMGASVHACEVDPRLARVAGQVAEANPGGDRVEVVAMDCRAMTVPEHMPQRADLALFELFDCSLIGEGVLHFLAYAREHLLEADARYLPMGGRLRAMLVEYRLDRVWDVDVNILNPYRFSPEFINVDARSLDYRPLSDPFDVFAFDFAQADPSPQENDVDLVATAPGIAGGILFWFDLQMGPDRWLSNEPGQAPGYHWKQGLQFLPEVQVEPAMALPLTMRHNGSALMFRWRQDALPAEAFSQLPRFDPRVAQQASELQSQTADLFQHCMSDPLEYRRVAELAQRFAADPSAHGLDPRIAERFVSKFLPVGA